MTEGGLWWWVWEEEVVVLLALVGLLSSFRFCLRRWCVMLYFVSGFERMASYTGVKLVVGLLMLDQRPSADKFSKSRAHPVPFTGGHWTLMFPYSA